MYVAIYVRVSTGQQVDGTSLDSQVDLCLRKANELGFLEQTIKIYREEGFSGEDIDRPAMNQLREDISSGIVDHIIITHPDRLSRNLTDKLFVCRELESIGVDLIFVDTEYKTTPEGQLFFNLVSVIAEYELSLIKKRTVNGRLRAVERDKKIMPMRVAPYGYDFIDGKLIINIDEAEFVKKIYEWYVYDRLTLRQIGELLYKLGSVPKRKESKNWSASSIRRILTSEIYIGKYYYNRRKTSKVKGEKTESGSPRKTYEIRPEEEWIQVEVPSIIDQSLFNMAQEQKEKNIKKSGNIKYNYLLKSLIRCGHCGRLWQATTYAGRENKQTGEKEKYLCYRCPNLFPKKYGEGVEKCPTQTIRAEQIEDYIWNMILEMVADPALYISRLQQNAEKFKERILDAAILIKQQINQKEKEKEKVKIMFKREVIDEEEMAKEFKKLNNETKMLQKELVKYDDQLNNYKKTEMSKEKFSEVSRLVKSIVAGSNDVIDFEDKRYIVNTLVDEILIKFENDEVHITAIGALDELKKNTLSNKVNNTQVNDIESCSQRQEV